MRISVEEAWWNNKNTFGFCLSLRHMQSDALCHEAAILIENIKYHWSKHTREREIAWIQATCIRRKWEQPVKREKQQKAYSGNPSCRLQCQEVSLGLRVIAYLRGKSMHALCLLGVAAVLDQPVCENCHYTGQNSCNFTVCTVSILTLSGCYRKKNIIMWEFQFLLQSNVFFTKKILCLVKHKSF